MGGGGVVVVDVQEISFNEDTIYYVYHHFSRIKLFFKASLGKKPKQEDLLDAKIKYYIYIVWHELFAKQNLIQGKVSILIKSTYVYVIQVFL